jgi:hypothetical protein
MSAAWLELHTVLSLRVDAREAYRLMHAYRDEELRKRSERTTGTAEAYPGELDMFRQLVRTLRVVVRPDDPDVAEVRRLLHQHASDEAAAHAENREKSSPRADATPDLHGRVLNALSSAQGPLLPLPAHTRRLLAAAVTDAVTPLVPYREVWDSSLPPGGRVCSICGQPVESEPCPDHAPTDGTPGPTGRVAQLLDTIRTSRGRWTTTRAAKFYRDARLEPPGAQWSRTRTVARGDLRDLAAWGHLIRHEEPGRQYFTLKTRKDGRS